MAIVHSSFKKIALYGKRGLKALLLAMLIYFTVILIGLMPINNDSVPAPQGIKIYIISSAVHADIVVPRQSEVINWEESFSNSSFAGDISNASHLAFGWGDQGFFLETETWDDLKLSVAANALFFPSKSALHVSFIQPEYYAGKIEVTLSYEQYKRLVDFISESFKKDDKGGFIQIPGYAYSVDDAFFHAKGSYHLLNTCNSWVGRALKASGVRVPWFAPMPNSPTLYIKSNVS